MKNGVWGLNLNLSHLGQVPYGDTDTFVKARRYGVMLLVTPKRLICGDTCEAIFMDFSWQFLGVQKVHYS